ncbi:DUF72 domain-containing protein [Allosphingosinicella vermicomposti]|uniref:DUF72 domain-containing protein n=1 Tax=Allosphingosinicella vermicomposti TaxID=614671 RepID=UPI000D0F0BF1|nr:DUF72 domain-containing protein [Allosphingosinicella vermicomposti]
MTIRIGIGGWSYEPWRGTFFPDGLPKTKELDYASRRLTAIEINGTFYGSQKPATFAKWRDATPDGFVFTLKASRYCTNRKILGEAGGSIEKFLTQGITELGGKLGPILWQFAATKEFDPDDFAQFLALLPEKQDGLPLRHALEVRHDSFKDPDFIALAAKHKAAIVFADSPKYPAIADQTSDFTYARLLNADEGVQTGYSLDALDHWAAVAHCWEKGEMPDGLEHVTAQVPAKEPRDVYLFFINGAKVRAPAAAQALIERVS